MYPDTFPLSELSLLVAHLRGKGSGDVPALAHAVWTVLGYALAKTLGDPDESAPYPPAPAFAAGPVAAEAARLADDDEALAGALDTLRQAQQPGVAMTAGSLPAWLVPVLISVLQRLLVG